MTDTQRLTLTATERAAALQALAALDQLLGGPVAMTAAAYNALAQQRDDLRRLLATRRDSDSRKD